MLVMTGVLLALCATGNVTHPIYPATGNVDTWKREAGDVIAMTPEQLLAAVPIDSGICFCGCPKCANGDEEGAMQWELALGDKVKCKYCGGVFPNDTYPDTKEHVVLAPSGRKQVYRYYEDAKGVQYCFQAKAWYLRWQWMQNSALRLANLYALTKDPQYGDRAAVIVGRFAQVFPDYAIRYDYPFRPKRFWPGDRKFPYDPDIETYRGAKWYWWGYGDIPATVAKSYDLIAAGDSFERMKSLLGADIRDRIECDLLRLGYDFTAANPETYSNMSPGMYSDMIVVGRVIGAPEIVHDAVTRFSELVRRNFFFDGWWREGTPSYHQQTIGHLQETVKSAAGYSDPPDWTKDRFDNLDLLTLALTLTKACAANATACLPNGRALPINDTWWFDKRTPPTPNLSALWPAMGQAMLNSGSGTTAFQVDLNWSGGFGHSHADNASMILYAFGKELSSDIGYTHTRYRQWTINSASHNLVVVDGRSQVIGGVKQNTTGNARLFDAGNGRVQVVSVDAQPAYPALQLYRRTLISVHAGEGRDYVVDIFAVKGGKQHDYFLHGSADEQGTLETSAPLTEPVASLVPSWGKFEEPANEQALEMSGEKYHPYGFLWFIASGPISADWSATWRYGDAGMRSHFRAAPGDRAYRFTSPAIRLAGHEDTKLHDYLRNGVLIRRESGDSVFAAVHEPFSAKPWIESVAFDDGQVTVHYDKATDQITWNDDSVHVTSGGVAYALESVPCGRLKGVERSDDRSQLLLDTPVPDSVGPSPFHVRLTFPGGRSIIYPATGKEGNRITLQDDPGFTFDSTTQATQYTSFPQEQFTGPVEVAAMASR